MSPATNTLVTHRLKELDLVCESSNSLAITSSPCVVVVSTIISPIKTVHDMMCRVDCLLKCGKDTDNVE